MTPPNDLERIDCCNCSVRFGVPAGFTAYRRQDKRMFYCPNGHPQSFTESEADRLRRDLQRQQQQNARLAEEAHQAHLEREAAERRASAARGQVTRLKNRAANGVCPCCNRSFSDLRRHMATKHPDFRAEETVDG